VAPESLDEFQQAIVTSGLMGIRDLQDVVSQLAAREAPCDATLLARELIERGLLTKFQVNKIFHNVADQLAFGRYRLVEPVGRGGFGSVYRGLDTATGEAVALKLLGMRRKDAEHAVVRFQREIATTLSLAHSHIVRSLDAGYHNRQLYLVMELVDGLNLHQLVSRSGPLDIATAIEYARQAAVGLAFAHSQGVIHRDVKPSNLLLEPSGRIKVGDFGLARRIDALGWGDGESMVTLTGMVIGSVDFIAPEQAVDFKRADERSDVYGLGCTLLFLLTGKTRFTGQTTEEKMARLRSPVGEPPVDLTALRREIPKPLEKLFPQLIAWDPEKRLASMNVVAKRLTEIVAELAVTDLRSTGRRAV
jgi:serine/threonine-protein kinase